MEFCTECSRGAVADELIESNPCAIKRGELPAKIDKDPTWRSAAVFTREEVEQLIYAECPRLDSNPISAIKLNMRQRTPFC